MRHRVLITGGKRGIGEAITQRFVQGGYEVVAIGSAEVDLRSPRQARSFIESMADKPDIIINNAGINPIALFEDIKAEDIESTMNVMFHSPLALIRGSVGTMRSRGFGRIVNLGSVWSIVSKPGRLSYSSAKHAIDGLTNTLALELAEHAILVNTVCPGFVDTEMTRQNNSSEEIEALCKQVPLGRIASPNEIAELVYFLGSEQNTYITGQKLVIDGGYTIQ